MRKLNKKVLISSLIAIVCIGLYVPNIAYASGFKDKICEMIGGVICFFGDGLVFLCDALGGQFDKLIFNYDGSSLVNDMNLTILKGDTISQQIISIYRVMQVIGSMVLITVSLWITMDFIRAADNVQHKVILKDRLKKMILAIFLLNSIPVVVDVLLAINYAFTDTFKLITDDFLPSSLDYGKSFLTETFKNLYDKAEGSEALVISVVYLIAAFINVWLIIFYMIRDLAISFLMILAPIMISVLPYRVDLSVSWLKEMVSNIFTQSIQAVIFTIVISIVGGLTNDSDLYAQIFALVAFAMFIPFTATIKKMLGLEGNIGVANSRAGLGAAIMTVALAGKALNGMKNQAGMLHQSNEQIKDLKSERDNFEKSNLGNTQLRGYNGEMSSKKDNRYSGSNLASNLAAVNGFADSDMGMAMTGIAMGDMHNGSTKGFTPVNTRNFPRDKNVIEGEINAIRKQRNSAMIRGATSALGTGIMAAGASGLGTMGAFTGANIGSSLGDTVGFGMHTAGSKAYLSATEAGKDALYGKGIRPDTLSVTNGNKNWSLDNVGYNIGNMKNNLTSNIDKRVSDFKNHSPIMGAFINDDKQMKDFEINTDSRQDDITGLTGDPLRETEYYQQEKDSRLQAQKLIRQGEFAKASRYRLQTSANTHNLTRMKEIEDDSINNNSNKQNTMLYTDSNSSILFTQNNDSGEREVLATFEGNPNLSSPTMENVTFNADGDIPVGDVQRSNFKQQAVNLAISKFGEESVYDKNNDYYQSSQTLINNETNKLIDDYRNRISALRQQTGSSKLVVNGSVDFTNISKYNTIPQPTTQVDINIPNNIKENHYASDVYTNIELSKKEIQLNQQREFTTHLKQGISELYGGQ